MIDWLRQRTPVVLIGALAIVAIAAACGDDETTNPTDDTAGDTIVVSLTDGPAFSPGEVTISTGDVVKWVDEEDGMGHTVTPDGHSEWTSENMPDGADPFTHKFDSAGTFPYICIPHEGAGMVGTVIVQ